VVVVTPVPDAVAVAELPEAALDELAAEPEAVAVAEPDAEAEAEPETELEAELLDAADTDAAEYDAETDDMPETYWEYKELGYAELCSTTALRGMLG